jgi:hypothetical protein
MPTKICDVCGCTKNISEFGKSPTCKGGYRNRCKQCRNKLRLDWDNAKHLRHRGAFLKSAYGLSLEKYLEMYERQIGVCAICNSPIRLYSTGEESKHGTACVDHNHITGEIRSLLCFPCNLAIGNIKESPETADKIAYYLRAWGVV